VSAMGRWMIGALIAGASVFEKTAVPKAQQITTGDAEWFWPTWSADGREILAASTPKGADTEIYVLGADGSGARAVGSAPSTDRHPRWVGSELIAFDSDRHGKFDVFVVRPDGSGLLRLTTDALDDAAAFPSPDGQWIAFSSNRGGRWALYVVRPDGTGERKLVDLPKHVYSPAWSSDGKRIVFTTATPNADIYEVEVESGTIRPLVATDASETMVRLSGDGRRVIYLRGDGPNRDLMMVAADGSGARQLSVPSGELSWLAWCPDNRNVVFTRTDAGNEDVYAVDVDSGRLTRLTDDPARDTAPACGPGGRVVFGSARAPKMNLFVVTIP
jgi:Tol biopolymer transport system component